MTTKKAAKKNSKTAPAKKAAKAAPAPAKKAPKVSRPARGAAAVAPVVAAQEVLAAAGAKHIGSIIYWNGAPVDVPRAEVRAMFSVANFEHLVPESITAGHALSRAATEGSRPRGYVVRAFERPNKDTPVAFGVYLVQANEGEAGDGQLCGARVRVDAAGVVVALPPEGADALPDALALAEQIATKANRLVTHVAAKDVSAALVKAASEMGAAPLRILGGVYYLPPASDAPENVAAAREAAQGALDVELQQLAEDLERAQTDGMRVGSIETRMETLAAVKARAELYRSVLEGIADDIGAAASTMEAAFQAQLDKEREAMAAKGKAAPEPGTAAAKLSDAAHKAWETRRRLAAERAAAAPASDPAPAVQAPEEAAA